MAKFVAPSIEITAFNCPHCGALAQQFWRNLAAIASDKDDGTPTIVTHKYVDEIEADGKLESEKKLLLQFRKMADGNPVLWPDYVGDKGYQHLANLNLSICYQCDEVTIWLRERIIWPFTSEAPEVNVDLPTDIRNDYAEAASILNLSPRGAAALLRLAIQKLCKHLEAGGKDLNEDIANLVKRGLDSRIQQALDIVRVIGNNAVHPGTVNLKDDTSTATRLFELVNLIAERMISEPKHVSSMFDALPEGAKKGIADRDREH